jgi:hypothetical protein
VRQYYSLLLTKTAAGEPLARRDPE